MRRLVDGVLKARFLVCVVAVGVIVGGVAAYRLLPVDAFPDVTPALVQVFVETEGLAPEEVEKYVTYPIEVAMNGLPRLQKIRSVSNFGLSVVNIYFEDGTDIYFARQLVGERLALAREEIPEGFGEPEMGPITTGLGQILFYMLEDETGRRSPRELREIQDWIVKFHLQTVPGVTEVLSLGGEVKQFHILVRPEALLRYDLSLHEVVEAVRAGNANAGAQFVERGSEEAIVRAVGLARTAADLERIVVKSEDGRPVYLSDVAEVVVAGDGELRRGLATTNGEREAVVGMVLKLIGTNTSTVIEAVRERMAEINKILPEGVRTIPYYDQATLVAACVRTVESALFQGVLLVVIVLFFFMGSVRPSLVVCVAIPFSILFAAIGMRLLGISANLMSLGGLAIAIGMMVDGTIVIVENIDRVLRRDPGLPRDEAVARAAAEVVRPIVFAIAIIIVVFLPLFTLQGVEGKTFRPLAQTVSLAMLGSLVFAAFVAPVAAFFLMRPPARAEDEDAPDAAKENRVVRAALRVYRPLVEAFVRRARRAVVLAVALLAAGGAVFPLLGSEFVPRLDEGDLLVRITMAPSISLREARETVFRFERRLMERFPEVRRIVTRVGRGEVGAHADPVNNAEAFVALAPKDEWTTAKTAEELHAAMSEAFEDFPGAQFNFTQPIAVAVDELLTGTRAELAIKIYGEDLEVLAAKAAEIEAVVRTIPGAADVQKDQVTGTPQLRIRLDRDALARHGLSIEEVEKIVSAAVGGEQAGQVFEGIRRFDVLVRYPPEARRSPEAIGRVLVPTPDGRTVPLASLAAIDEIVGPRQITRENNQRFITVQCNVRGRDIGSFVAEAKAAIARTVDLPPGYLIEWGGQFEQQEAANRRLALVVPATLLLVFLLLYSSFNSFKNAVLILLNIPLALAGGVIGLYLAGENLSVPASVGFIALFGIALENGMVLVSTMNGLLREGRSLAAAAVEGACRRLRAVLMTALTTALGLVPLLFSHGTGSEVQRPLAIVVVGGLVTSTVLTLLVLPALYRWFADTPEEAVF